MSDVCNDWDVTVNGLVGLWYVGEHLERELIWGKYLLYYRLFASTLDHLFQCRKNFKRLLSGKVA